MITINYVSAYPEEMLPLRERKIFHVQAWYFGKWNDTEWGNPDAVMQGEPGSQWRGNYEEARRGLRNALKYYPGVRFRIHFTIPADIGESWEPECCPAHPQLYAFIKNSARDRR